jgi:uncharacterized Tic20 family protein
MWNIVAVLVGLAGFGAFLASSWAHVLPLRAGYVGALILVGMALAARWHWRRRARLAGDDPSATERRAWLYMAGTSMICAYVISVLMTPGSEVHRATGDTGGFDSWTMLAGAAIAWWLLHDSSAARDERDVAIDAYANKVGYTALVVLLLAFLLMLGFAPRASTQRFTHWLIANSLLTLIMLATLAQYVAQLICYWRDRQAIAAGGGR